VRKVFSVIAFVLAVYLTGASKAMYSAERSHC
jgi:hypothetical protein